MSNRIIIGGRNRKEVIPKAVPNGSMGVYNDTAAVSVKKTDPVPLDEQVWGNDNAILDKIDKGLLADRRLFVRVRHVQKVICGMEYEDVAKEPLELDMPLELMIVDLSVAGIGIICDREIAIGRILGLRILLDGIPYDIKCEVVYCILVAGKFRAGLKIAQKDKRFMRHLKIFVARVSLTSEYASGE